ISCGWLSNKTRLALPEIVVGLVENASAQRQKSIQAIRGPAHAGALEASSHNRLTSRFSDPTADMHPLCSKRRITHPLGVGGKVVTSFFRHTAALPRLGSKRGQGSDGGEQFFNVAMHKQIACLFGPNGCGFCLRSIDGTSDLPEMLLSVVEIHNLDSSRKVCIGSFPNPSRSISQDHDLLGLFQP